MFQLDLFSQNTHRYTKAYEERLEAMIMDAMGDDYEDAVLWDNTTNTTGTELAPPKAHSFLLS